MEPAERRPRAWEVPATLLDPARGGWALLEEPASWEARWGWALLEESSSEPEDSEEEPEEPEEEPEVLLGLGGCRA